MLPVDRIRSSFKQADYVILCPNLSESRSSPPNLFSTNQLEWNDKNPMMESPLVFHQSMAPLSKRDKQRVTNADPNGGRCLVTNAFAPLTFCHCIPTDTEEKIV